MDQNQISVDNDLQKAIDDITNNTSADPVFADPVAAPSSIPEGEANKLDEPVGPFPAPAPEPEVPPVPELPQMPPESLPTPPQEIAPAPNPVTAPEPTPESTPIIPQSDIDPVPQSLGIDQLKKAALRDLTPLLDKVNMEPSQKFKIYRDIFDDLKDYTVLEPAYKSAREIANETERAEALLYLVESIDKM